MRKRINANPTTFDDDSRSNFAYFLFASAISRSRAQVHGLVALRDLVRARYILSDFIIAR